MSEREARRLALAHLDRAVALLSGIDELDDRWLAERDGWTAEAQRVWLDHLRELRTEIEAGGGTTVAHDARHLARELDHWGIGGRPRDVREPFGSIDEALSELQLALLPIAEP